MSEQEAEERLRQELRQYLAGPAEHAALAPERRERIRTIPTRHPLDTQGERQTPPIESKAQQRNRPRQSGRRAETDMLLHLHRERGTFADMDILLHLRHLRHLRDTFWAPNRKIEINVSENARRLHAAFWKWRLVAYCRNELGDATLAEDVAHLVERQYQALIVEIAAGRKPAQLTDIEYWLVVYASYDWFLMCAHVACTRMKRRIGSHRFSEREGATRSDREDAYSTPQLPAEFIAHISDRLTEEEKTLIHTMADRGTDTAMPEVQALADLLGPQRVAQLRRKIRAMRKALQQFSLDEE